MEGTEDDIPDEELEDHIVQWPAQLPKRARLKKRPQSEQIGNSYHAIAKARFARCTHACNPLPQRPFTN